MIVYLSELRTGSTYGGIVRSISDINEKDMIIQIN
jgi:hypothetical protein